MRVVRIYVHLFFICPFWFSVSQNSSSSGYERSEVIQDSFICHLCVQLHVHVHVPFSSMEAYPVTLHVYLQKLQPYINRVNVSRGPFTFMVGDLQY